MKAGRRSLRILLAAVMTISLCGLPAFGAYLENTDFRDGSLTGAVALDEGEALSAEARFYAATYDALTGQFLELIPVTADESGEFSVPLDRVQGDTKVKLMMTDGDKPVLTHPYSALVVAGESDASGEYDAVYAKKPTALHGDLDAMEFYGESATWDAGEITRIRIMAKQEEGDGDMRLYSLCTDANGAGEQRDAWFYHQRFSRPVTLEIDGSARDCGIDFVGCAFEQGLTVLAPAADGSGRTFSVNFRDNCAVGEDCSVTFREAGTDAQARAAMLQSGETDNDAVIYWSTVRAEVTGCRSDLRFAGDARVSFDIFDSRISLDGVTLAAGEQGCYADWNWNELWNWDKESRRDVLYGFARTLTLNAEEYPGSNGAEQDALDRTVVLSGAPETTEKLRLGGMVDIIGLQQQPENMRIELSGDRAAYLTMADQTVYVMDNYAGEHVIQAQGGDVVADRSCAALIVNGIAFQAAREGDDRLRVAQAELSAEQCGLSDGDGNPIPLADGFLRYDENNGWTYLMSDAIREAGEIYMDVELDGGVTVSYAPVLWENQFNVGLGGFLDRVLWNYLPDYDGNAILDPYREERVDRTPAGEDDPSYVNSFALAVESFATEPPLFDDDGYLPQQDRDGYRWWNTDDRYRFSRILEYGEAKAILATAWRLLDGEGTLSVALRDGDDGEWDARRWLNEDAADRLLRQLAAQLPKTPVDVSKVTFRRDGGETYALFDGDTENRHSPNLVGLRFQKPLEIVLDDSALDDYFSFDGCAFGGNVTVNAPGADHYATLDFRGTCSMDQGVSLTVREADGEAVERENLAGLTLWERDERLPEFERWAYWDTLSLEGADGLTVETDARVHVRSYGGGAVTVNGLTASRTDGGFDLNVSYDADWYYDEAAETDRIRAFFRAASVSGEDYWQDENGDNAGSAVTLTGATKLGQLRVCGVTDVSGLNADGMNLFLGNERRSLTVLGGNSIGIPGDVGGEQFFETDGGTVRVWDRNWWVDPVVNGDRTGTPHVYQEDGSAILYSAEGYDDSEIRVTQDGVKKSTSWETDGSGNVFLRVWDADAERLALELNRKPTENSGGYTLIYDPLPLGNDGPVSVSEFVDAVVEVATEYDSGYVLPDADEAVVSAVWPDYPDFEKDPQRLTLAVKYGGITPEDGYDHPDSTIRYDTARRILARVYQELKGGELPDSVALWRWDLDREEPPEFQDETLDRNCKNELVFEQFRRALYAVGSVRELVQQFSSGGSTFVSTSLEVEAAALQELAGSFPRVIETGDAVMLRLPAGAELILTDGGELTVGQGVVLYMDDGDKLAQADDPEPGGVPVVGQDGSAYLLRGNDWGGCYVNDTGATLRLEGGSVLNVNGALRVGRCGILENNGGTVTVNGALTLARASDPLGVSGYPTFDGEGNLTGLDPQWDDAREGDGWFDLMENTGLLNNGGAVIVGSGGRVQSQGGGNFLENSGTVRIEGGGAFTVGPHDTFASHAFVDGEGERQRGEVQIAEGGTLTVDTADFYNHVFVYDNGDRFGANLLIDGTLLLTGADWDDDGGAAFICYLENNGSVLVGETGTVTVEGYVVNRGSWEQNGTLRLATLTPPAEGEQYFSSFGVAYTDGGSFQMGEKGKILRDSPENYFWVRVVEDEAGQIVPRPTEDFPEDVEDIRFIAVAFSGDGMSAAASEGYVQCNLVGEGEAELGQDAAPSFETVYLWKPLTLRSGATLTVSGLLVNRSQVTLETGAKLNVSGGTLVNEGVIAAQEGGAVQYEELIGTPVQ